MPTSAFLNLSEEKRKRIIDASVLEFSNNLFVDASINKIIKAIDMPRGSFYLYFENKDDLYFYIVGLYSDMFINKVKEMLSKNDGDLIDTFVGLYDDMVKINISDTTKKFIRNIFLNSNTQNMNQFFEKTEKSKKHEEIIVLVDKSKLNIDGDFDMFCMLKMLIILLVHSLSHVFNKSISEVLIRKVYVRQLNMLKKGFYI